MRFGVLTAQEQRDYEKLPVPFCIVAIRKDACTLLTASDGLCSALGAGREAFSASARELLERHVHPEDLSQLHSDLEHACLRPSGQYASVCRIRIDNGRSQSFTITPDDGYAIMDVLADGKSVGPVKSYTFSNIISNHTITAIFKKPGTAAFTDIAASDWFFDAVCWAEEGGLMNGVGDGKFAPNSPATRAMVLSILYRQAGSPNASHKGVWYADAQKWAMDNKVSDGTHLMNNITREQFVTILWRINGSPKGTLNKLNSFEDGVKTSDYAKEAMAWAIETGILNGKGRNRLDPTGTATRAETAALFMRLATK